MNLYSPSRNFDSKGSTANRSLSSAYAWAASCYYYPQLWSRGPDCRSFRFSHALVVTVGSTIELLVGCSGGQFA